VQECEQRAQRGRGRADRGSPTTSGFREHERAHVRRGEPLELDPIAFSKLAMNGRIAVT
jgi:hypothetical protein